jgi:hypothetical protein
MLPGNVSGGGAEASTTRNHESSCWQDTNASRERNISQSLATDATTQGGQPVGSPGGSSHLREALLLVKTGDAAGGASSKGPNRRPEEINMQWDDVHLIVDTLRSGTDQTSAKLLAGLRMGISVGDLAQSIRGANTAAFTEMQS